MAAKVVQLTRRECFITCPDKGNAGEISHAIEMKFFTKLTRKLSVIHGRF